MIRHGDTIELADGQLTGTDDEGRRFGIPAGSYIVTRAGMVAVEIHNIDTGRKWTALAQDILGVTEAVEGGRSYKPLVKEPQPCQP
jgi:hypothetical protein